MSAGDSGLASRVERALHAYHDGELRGLRRWRFERQLSRSPELRAEFESLQSLSRWVRESDPEPETDLWDRVALRLPAIDAERDEVRPSPGFWPSYSRPLTALALTAALALALFLGIIRGDGSSAPGIIRWMDTGGRSVMVLDDQSDATIVWLLGSPQEGASLGGVGAAV
jgi:anti-sigma factor RsiW